MVLTIFFSMCFVVFSSITYGFFKDAHKCIQPMIIKMIFICSAALALWTFVFSVVAFFSWLI